jgi:hypothetical protein
LFVLPIWLRKENAPPSHHRFSATPSSDFFAAGFEVYSIVTELTAEQKTIAITGQTLLALLAQRRGTGLPS